MDPVSTGISAAQKIFGMTSSQLANSPPSVSGVNQKTDSATSVTFNTGDFNTGGAPSFSMLFFAAAVLGAGLFFYFKAHK